MLTFLGVQEVRGGQAVPHQGHPKGAESLVSHFIRDLGCNTRNTSLETAVERLMKTENITLFPF